MLTMLSLMLVLVASFVGSGLPPEAASAQQESPQSPVAETPPFHMAYDGLLDAPHLPPAGAAGAPQAALAPEYAAWSRLVFQSLRNEHDWEVYGARGDGSDQVNLSNNGGMDVHPRLNRGATAWSSPPTAPATTRSTPWTPTAPAKLD